MKLSVLITCLLFVSLFSCNKENEGYNAIGGQLPSNYILIKDSSFSPAVLSVVVGSSITFSNQTNLLHTIVSDDTVAIKSTPVAGGLSFVIKPLSPGPIFYHCAEHPNAKGLINITF